MDYLLLWYLIFWDTAIFWLLIACHAKDLPFLCSFHSSNCFCCCTELFSWIHLCLTSCFYFLSFWNDILKLLQCLRSTLGSLYFQCLWLQSSAGGHLIPSSTCLKGCLSFISQHCYQESGGCAYVSLLLGFLWYSAGRWLLCVSAKAL